MNTKYSKMFEVCGLGSGKIGQVRAGLPRIVTKDRSRSVAIAKEQTYPNESDYTFTFLTNIRDI